METPTSSKRAACKGALDAEVRQPLGSNWKLKLLFCRLLQSLCGHTRQSTTTRWRKVLSLESFGLSVSTAPFGEAHLGEPATAWSWFEVQSEVHVGHRRIRLGPKNSDIDLDIARYIDT